MFSFLVVACWSCRNEYLDILLIIIRFQSVVKRRIGLYEWVKSVFLFYIRAPFDSILEAVFTVSPNKQYRGIFKPTTPDTHMPAKIEYGTLMVEY